MFCFLFFFANPLDLAAIYGSNKIFTIVNLVLLSMVTVFLFRKIKFKNGKTHILLSASLAFFCFWLGLFLFLVYSMVIHDTGVLIGCQIARIVGFALFVQIYYSARKGGFNRYLWLSGVKLIFTMMCWSCFGRSVLKLW